MMATTRESLTASADVVDIVRATPPAADRPAAQPASPALAASWARSTSAGVRKDRFNVPYVPDLERNGRLSRAAGVVLQRLARDIAGAPVAVVFADHEGQVLDRSAGDAGSYATLDDLRLAPGYRWDEATVGTNGIGTALAQDAPVDVTGAEHFADALAGMACAAVPVSDPRTGRSVGVVSVAGEVATVNALMAPLARRTARDVEDVLVDGASVATRALIERFVHARRHERGGLVAVSARTMLTNAAAHMVADDDRPLLWAWAERAVAGRRARPATTLTLVSGTTVRVRAEPVTEGGLTVGALLRVDQAPPLSGDPGGPHARGVRPRFGWPSLTASERGVADLVGNGLSNRETARRLFLSPHTVDFHLRQIYRKLEIGSRVELAALVAQR
jgi:transcriptional regulator of acetoin/glycerol metabolism/DNA-binding CsgD family transcriptional regulator